MLTQKIGKTKGAKIVFEDDEVVGILDNKSYQKYLKKVAIDVYKKDLIALGEKDMAEHIIYERA